MLGRIVDRLRGKAVTIPPMDGALRPNGALDGADAILTLEAPDNLVAVEDRLYFSSGATLLAAAAVDSAAAETVATFASPISALAAAPDGGLAIGLDDGTVLLRSAAGEARPIEGDDPLCPTALAFADASTLIVCQGAAGLHPSDWTLDLMRKGSSGAVWRIDLNSEERTAIARNLAFPAGVLVRPDGALVVAESWRHRLVRIPPGGGRPAEPLLANLPGYPGRLAPASGGGAWLSLFAPRNRLIEFILQEDDYRADMIRDIEPAFWIAPTLTPRQSFLEPLQCGSVRTMGIHKPWAPSRSYGLFVRLDPGMKPRASFHSRSDGVRHGVTSAAEAKGRVFVTAKGGNVVLSLPQEAA